MTDTRDTQALMTVRDLVRWGASEFGRRGLSFGHGTDNALDEAFHLVLHQLHLSADLPTLYLESAVTASEREAVLNLLQQRIDTRKPAAYLIGEIQFCGMSFYVDERVLVPRSPIAEMIEARFEPWITGEPLQILDLCTGSGCIGIACADVFEDAEVDLAEIDGGALEVCRRNIARHDLATRVTAIQSDLFDALGGRRYDLIVSNPPYVPSAEWEALSTEFKREPKLALEAGEDGMDIVERILTEAPDFLAEDGLLVCEIGGSIDEFEARYPTIPVSWPEFTRGGDGVFVIARAELVSWLETR
ncbi:MAG: ribosomal protein N(5)-glutamine methyltransferase [Hydrocarboniphaga sp.]|uniref:50S ribosomal protein L3 N(5)-glutamine methyltransferase n=1 Tax=Hydrocarboniphaga sp. TaxID=2033016 RepID=UPI002614CCD8|nr:50S ribosomal protein L3 N(5)-glutamine methyltransferase [Hydrocarboniphaga sp.]MDB5969036.1 ribosomal protein N(5)-glutamine methyltransferase [Hydrocarboniphaga sp.]